MQQLHSRLNSAHVPPRWTESRRDGSRLCPRPLSCSCSADHPLACFPSWRLQCGFCQPWSSRLEPVRSSPVDPHNRRPNGWSPWTPRVPLPSATCITPERVRTRDPCAARGVSRGEVQTGAGSGAGASAQDAGGKLCAGVQPPFFLPLPQPTVLAPLSAAFRRLWWSRGHTVRAARSISGFEPNRIQDLSPAHFDARAEA